MGHYTQITAENGQIIDIAAEINGRAIAMLGPAGAERELAAIKEFLANPNLLPVFLGSGMGHALQKVLAEYAGPVAIIDAEQDLQELTSFKSRFPAAAWNRITLITNPDPQIALSQLAKWQDAHGKKDMQPIAIAFYQRLNPGYYGSLRKSISASHDFWAKARLPRFINPVPRVLLLASKYFLIGEIERACAKLNIPHKLVMVGQKAVDGEAFVKQVLEVATSFRPDCCITLNHMGVDMEGVLMELLARLNLPIASWFVDNPHLIIHLYSRSVSPWATIFTWDEDNLPTLRSAGYENVAYLPLGTDPERFRPNAGKQHKDWRAKVSFVGNSMLYKVGARLKDCHFPAPLLRAFHSVARSFAASEDRSVAAFLAERYQAVYTEFEKLQDNDLKLAYETAITWKATQIYRYERVAELIPFQPLIVGDKGWHTVFRKARPQPRLLDTISYYSQLPIFYGQSDINFNCTSRQMKGAVNQRVFDAPAAGGFVLTDWRPQMAGLFTKEEMACYHEPGEIPGLVNFYLDHPKERQRITHLARKRILACHTWANRLESMLKTMRNIYGTPNPPAGQ